MLHITNRKVASFDPRWASFHGFSILFNNPGGQCLRKNSYGAFDLVNNVDSDPGLQFYKILEEGVRHLNVDSLAQRFLFCSLPSTTYHVTLWGGLNDRHTSQIHFQYQSIVQNWLSNLPKSFGEPPEDIFQLPMLSSLCTKRDWNLNFRFDQLKIWNNSVLVAVLRPDPNSEPVLEQLVEERHQLNQQFHDRFGVFTDSKTYSPHVSLGYFANEEGAQKALDFVDDWNAWFSSALRDSTLAFDNASIYGLTDMISFFKRNET